MSILHLRMVCRYSKFINLWSVYLYVWWYSSGWIESAPSKFTTSWVKAVYPGLYATDSLAHFSQSRFHRHTPKIVASKSALTIVFSWASHFLHHPSSGVNQVSWWMMKGVHKPSEPPDMKYFLKCRKLTSGVHCGIWNVVRDMDPENRLKTQMLALIILLSLKD